MLTGIESIVTTTIRRTRKRITIKLKEIRNTHEAFFTPDGKQVWFTLKDIGKTEVFDAHLPFSNTIWFITCIRLVNYALVTDGNRETNLVAMVAVKANSVKCHLIVIVYHMISNAEK